MHDRSSTDSLDDPTTSFGRVSYLQQRYQAEGISRNVAELLISATRCSTQKRKKKQKQQHTNPAGNAGAVDMYQDKLILFLHS